MARRRRGPKAATGAAAAAAAAAAEVAPADEQRPVGPTLPRGRPSAAARPRVPATAPTTLADLPAEVLLEVAVRLPTTRDVHAFASRTCRALRQQLAGAASPMLKARWLLHRRHERLVRYETVLHGDVEVLEALLALTARPVGPDDPDDSRQEDLNDALEEAAARDDRRMTAALMAAGSDVWFVMARAIGTCYRGEDHADYQTCDNVVGVLMHEVGAEAPAEVVGDDFSTWTFPDGGEALRRELDFICNGDDADAGADGAERLCTMLGDASWCGRVWIVRVLLAAGADAGRAIDELTMDEMCRELRDAEDGSTLSEYRQVMGDLSRAGPAALRRHMALVLAARFGTASDVRGRLSDLGDGGGGMGGRAGAVVRALQVAPYNPHSPAVVAPLLQEAAGGQGQGHVGQGALDEALDEALCNALWASEQQPFAATKEVLGLLTAAGATVQGGDPCLDGAKGDVVVALALALREAGAGDDWIDRLALEAAAKGFGELRQLQAVVL